MVSPRILISSSNTQIHLSLFFFLTLTEHNIDVINLFEELYTTQTPWLHTGLRISVEWSLPPAITVPNRQEPTVAHVHNFPIILKT